jgi:pimeloyl-ACP methyl ester carboxylesterase
MDPGGVADALADEFTATAYDRRGNSRSPRPTGWTQTSLAEQADDAAALLATLGQRPAVVVGTGAGGSIALELALRHPQGVRAAIVHEPPHPGRHHQPPGGHCRPGGHGRPGHGRRRPPLGWG